MIESFTVGAVFKLIDQASPALLKILRQVRELNASIDKARESMASLGKMPGITVAVGEVDGLAASWASVAKNAEAARLAMGRAGTAATRSATTSAAATGGGGRQGFANRFLPSRGGGGGGGGFHGGGGFRGHGAALAAGGAMFWGLDQAANTDDYAWSMADISGQPHTPEVMERFRKILRGAQLQTNYSLHDVGDASLSALRLLQETPGNGIDALPEILSAGAIEARRKRTGLMESVTSGAELAHQFREYSPSGMAKLFATFAAYSVADPRSLSAMTRASGYAVPTLSELGFDPSTILLAGTGLAQAGISSTKSGTWIRESATRAFAGTIRGKAGAFHDQALKLLGLADENGKPTFFGPDGKPDLLKLYGIAGDHLQGMAPEDRVKYGRAAFGVQGAGAVAVIGDPVVNSRMHAIDRLRQSPEFQSRYGSFQQDYLAGSPVQDARHALSEFNVTMGQLGGFVMPSAAAALTRFTDGLEKFRSMLPGGKDGKPSEGAIEAWGGGAIGTVLGGVVGAAGGPFGIAGGAVVGGVVGAGIGGVMGTARDYMTGAIARPVDRFGREVVITGNSAEQAAAAMKALGDAIRGLPAGRGVFPGGTSATPQISLSLNLDGRTLAQSVSAALATLSEHATGAPAFDGTSTFQGGDSNHSDN
jgi:hypothetical protein